MAGSERSRESASIEEGSRQGGHHQATRATKYRLRLYGPFREALDSAPRPTSSKADPHRQSTYQMDRPNGAKPLKSKPCSMSRRVPTFCGQSQAWAYLEHHPSTAARKRSCRFAANNVKRRIPMVRRRRAAAWIDERAIVLETLLCFSGLGPSSSSTYHACDAAPGCATAEGLFPPGGAAPPTRNGGPLKQKPMRCSDWATWPCGVGGHAAPTPSIRPSGLQVTWEADDWTYLPIPESAMASPCSPRPTPQPEPQFRLSLLQTALRSSCIHDRLQATATASARCMTTAMHGFFFFFFPPPFFFFFSPPPPPFILAGIQKANWLRCSTSPPPGSSPTNLPSTRFATNQAGCGDSRAG